MAPSTLDLRESFAALRVVTDPRGHSLLAVLEEYVVHEHAKLDAVLAALSGPPSNVIPLVRDYSERTSA
jgi:hypothetical protein